MSSMEKDNNTGGAPSPPNITTTNIPTCIPTGTSTNANIGATIDTKTRIHTRTNTRDKVGIPEKGSGQDRFRQLLPSFNPWGVHRRSMMAQMIPSSALTPAAPVAPAAPTLPGFPPEHNAPFPTYGMRMSVQPTGLFGGNVGKGVARFDPPRVKVPQIEVPQAEVPRVDAPQFQRPTNSCKLSRECQKRSFNPTFHGWSTEDGKFKCSVTVKDKVIYDSASYRSTVDAKEAIAKQALHVVRKMPLPHGANKSKAAYEGHQQLKSGTVIGSSPPKSAPKRRESALELGEIKQETRGGRHTTPDTKSDLRHDGGRPREDNSHRDRIQPPSSRYLPDYYNGPSFNAQAVDHYRTPPRNEEYRILMNRVQSMFGNWDGPSQQVLNDPVACQAYLQGFAVGSRAEKGRAAEKMTPSPLKFRSFHPLAPLPPLEFRPIQVRSRREDEERIHFGGNFNRRERSPGPPPRVRVYRERSPLRRWKSSEA
ncbi:hypothetical protein GGR53DRAFT_533206 [Hypoxylon sp. FL1150]|nr:hypothetical protein GGR53DRAFT_533206 [Hypoxylon sp. FL1150]